MINALAEHEGSTAMWNVRALRDGDQWIDSFDPARDRVMIEIDGRLIGAGRVETPVSPTASGSIFTVATSCHPGAERGSSRRCFATMNSACGNWRRRIRQIDCGFFRRTDFTIPTVNSPLFWKRRGIH